MKPTFALDLSRDVIALLHRTPKGWMPIGEVAFDAPDMAETLDLLRKTALGLSPLGLACKIILPNNQVLYSEVHAPGPSREDKRRQIAQALVGRTPYAVEDLVFDWSGKGTVVRVAVVARETLEEAEAFAVAHRLNPVSFVTIPEEDSFIGEAWFGPSNCADTILAPGETVERDRDAVVILSRDLSSLPKSAIPETASSHEDLLPGLSEALNAEVTDADLVALASNKPKPETAEEFDLIEPLEDPAEDLLLVPPPPAALVAGEAGQLAEDALPAPESLAPPVNVAADAGAETMPESAEVAPKADTSVDAPGPVAASAVDLVDEAPFAEVSDEAEPIDPAKPDIETGELRVLAPDILDDDIPPPPSVAAMLAFSSRRSATPDAATGKAGRIPPPVVAGQAQPPAPRPLPPGATAPAVAAPAKPIAAGITAPGIPGLRPKPKSKPEVGAIPRPVLPGKVTAGPTTIRPASGSGSPFGPLPVKRRGPGFVFMVMIGLLLISLALVAAWASFFLTQASNEGGTDATAEVIEVPAELPSIDDEMAADLQDPEDLALTGDSTAAPALAEGEAADLAALAVEEMPVNIGGDESGPDPTSTVAEVASAAEDATALPGDPAAGSEAETAGAVESSGEAPPGTTIATDVSGSRTPVEDQDEILLATMDAPPPVLDAFALPAPTSVADTPPDAAMPPPAFGTVYQFGEDGLLVPTEDGILTPEGIMLFAGKPPVVPPARSAVAEAAAAAAAPPEAAPATVADVTTAADASIVTSGDPSSVTTEDALAAPVETVPSDPALAGFRPRPRPPELVKPDDGASLETAGEADFADLELGAQGASLAAQAEALAAMNPSIVAISMRPMARPTDLSRAVEAAVDAAVMEPDPGVEVELAAASPEAGSEEHAEYDEPDSDGAAPSIPTKASVAKQATFSNAINLSKTNLIGIFGTSSNPYALIRQSNGKYKKVQVGDKVDGGIVKAITEDEVRYQKGGKLVTLKMPTA